MLLIPEPAPFELMIGDWTFALTARQVARLRDAYDDVAIEGPGIVRCIPITLACALHVEGRHDGGRITVWHRGQPTSSWATTPYGDLLKVAAVFSNALR
ncbi:hypothetical protein ACIHFD_49795 [Nonomuraea sp. NPDC051941]|uniref:hypothetical protein n=1 Tax=Nonomuraea sp. NPDC051941 TaxID=3364373 RepID=UPI0037C58928